MVTQSIAINQITELLKSLVAVGYQPQRAILFGSLAKGTAHEHSDIDLAVWDSRFTGSLTIDYEPIVRLLTRFPRIELHTFSTEDSGNPFVSEIRKTGIEIDLKAALAIN